MQAADGRGQRWRTAAEAAAAGAGGSHGPVRVLRALNQRIAGAGRQPGRTQER